MKGKIIVSPQIMLGKPIIKGTRITVEQILRKLAQNISIEEILKDYPQLTAEDIQAVLDYAADSIRNEELYVLTEPH